MLPVIRSKRSIADLRKIVEYYDERSPTYAERLAEAIDRRIELLGQFPGMGRDRSELRPGLRSVVVEDQVNFFRVTPSKVGIVRIAHGARDLGKMFRRPRSEGSES